MKLSQEKKKRDGENTAAKMLKAARSGDMATVNVMIKSGVGDE